MDCKLGVCKNCLTVKAVLTDTTTNILNCRVCDKKIEHMILNGLVFQCDDIEEFVMSQFTNKDATC